MTVTRTRARLRTRMSAASAPLNRVLTGTSTAPACEQAERGHDPLGAVERPDGHPVARLDARGDQGGAEPAGPLDQLGVGEPACPPSTTAGSVTEPLGGGGDHRGDAGPPAGASGAHHRTTASSTFIRRARLPPMIFRTVSSGRPSSSST